MLEYKQKRYNGRTPFAGVYTVVCVCRGKFHTAGKQVQLLSRFHWLPANVSYKIYTGLAGSLFYIA